MSILDKIANLKFVFQENGRPFHALVALMHRKKRENMGHRTLKVGDQTLHASAKNA